MTTNRPQQLFLLLSVFTSGIALGACKGESTDNKQPTTDDTSATKAVPNAKTPAPTVAPTKTEEANVEIDLSPADASWAGWVAEAPKGAKVLKHGVKAARIATSGGPGSDPRAGFDLSWAAKKKDFAPHKASLQKGAAASKGKLKVTFVTDDPGLLAWTSEGYGATSYSFMMHMTVDGEDFTCENNAMIGLGSEALLEQHKAACKTLRRKK